MKVLFAIPTLFLVSCATTTVTGTETAEAAQQQQQQQVRGGGNRDLQKTVLGIKLYPPESAPGYGYSDLYTTTTAVTNTASASSSSTGTSTSTSLIVDSDQDLGYAFEYAQPTTVEAAVYSNLSSDGNAVRATPNTLIVNTSGRQDPGFRYYGYYTSKGGKKGAKGKGTCNGKGGGSQTRRPTPSPTRSPAAPPTTRAPASPTPENPEKAAFIREFGQQQYDCTTCGTTSTDTTCPPSCRTLGPGNAFDTNKCLVGVKGTYDAKTPNVTPDANFPKVGPEPVRGKCCQQTGFLPTWTGNSCSCVGGTPCVQPCGQGGPCFATGDPPVGCAFKGSTPPDSQCNKQKLSVSNVSRAGYYGGTRSGYYGCNYYGGKKGGYYTSKGGKKGSKGSKGKGKGGGARTRSPTQRPTPAPTTSLGPSSKLPAAVINTINQESPFLYLAYNPSDITSEGSLSYSTFCRPGKFLNVQFTNLTANGGNGEVFCINNTKNTSGTQLGYGSESPNFDTRFPTMKLNLNQTCDGDDDSGSSSGGKNYCGFRGKQSYFPLSQIVDTLTNDGNFDIDIENTASITTYCQVNEYTNVRAVSPGGTVICVTGAAGGIVNLVTNNEADIVEVLVDGKKSDNCDVPVDGLFTKGSTIRNITDSYPCGFNGVANTIFPNF